MLSQQVQSIASPIELGSPTDIAIIVVAILILFGPKKWSSLFADLRQGMSELRKITRNK